MARNGFPLIPVSLLVEDDSDSLQALIRQHRAVQKKAKPTPSAKPTPPGGGATSRQSVALSQLAKAFKGSKGATAAKRDVSSTPSEKPKTDAGLAKAAAAVSKGGAELSKKPDPRVMFGMMKPLDLAKVRAADKGGFKDPHMDVEHPPSKHAAFEHTTPSLKERTRPDVVPLDERHQDFHERYHAKGATLGEINHLPGSINTVFHGKMDDGTQYIMKPHGAGVQEWKPKEWGKRHNAVAQLLAHMGADHMVTPAMDAKGHDSAMIPAGHPSKEDKLHRSAHSHAGQDAFVTEFMPNTVKAGRATATQHSDVDGDHRLIGMITHLVSHNGDGHSGNVLIDKEHGHPVLIDHDLSMSSAVRDGRVRSVFAPGGMLDYQAKTGRIGTKFPPRVKKTLEWLAGGGHYHKEAGLGVSDQDGKVMQVMAEKLLKHGLEKTLKGLRDLWNH